MISDDFGIFLGKSGAPPIIMVGRRKETDKKDPGSLLFRYRGIREHIIKIHQFYFQTNIRLKRDGLILQIKKLPLHIKMAFALLNGPI